jgi:hypothetical protein
MPNWCENDLTITGKPEELQRFLDFAKGIDGGEETALDFNQFIPYPEEYRKLNEAAKEWRKQHPEAPWTDRPRDGYNQGGYEWCIENWGTKWTAMATIDEDYDLEDGELVMHFDTAWSPPLPVIKKASELFPALQFDLRYFECGVGFNGVYRCQGGQVEEDRVGDYFGGRGG